jgi:hypothetical protein
LARSHIPPQLFELAAHFSFGLSQIPRACRQDPAFEAHLLTAATGVVRNLVLLNIAPYLGN